MVMEPISRPSQAKGKQALIRKCVSMKKRTIRGERDGRIRLPFDVAYRFFAVHDKLGFPKASQTVEWLLSQSASAIENLSDFALVPEKKKPRVSRKRVHRSTVIDTCTKTLLSQASKKELRNSARARARERTMEKKRLRYLGDKGSSETPRWLEEVDMETCRSFDGSDGCLILMENQCEIIDQGFEWSDAILTWEDSSWEDCFSHVL